MVVFNNHFDLIVTLDRQQKTVAHIDAQTGSTTRKCSDHADFDSLIRRQCRTGNKRRCNGNPRE